jgi:hypothetical protein
MSPTPRPQVSAPGRYYSAYPGAIATDTKGNFTNFILMPDECHRKNGYWVFTTGDDQLRAYARVINNPEAILCAAERGDNPQHDISMSWRSGWVDTNITGNMTGNAGQHLKEIYDMRGHLGEPLSFCGQVPRYPVDSRLKGWWEQRRSASSSSTPRPLVTTTASPASPVSLAVSPLSSPRSQAEFRRTSSSMRQNSQRESVIHSRGAANLMTHIASPHGSGELPHAALSSSPPPGATLESPMRQGYGLQGTQTKSHVQSKSLTALPHTTPIGSSPRQPAHPSSSTVPARNELVGPATQTTYNNGHGTAIQQGNSTKQKPPNQKVVNTSIVPQPVSTPVPARYQDHNRSRQTSRPADSMLSTPVTGTTYLSAHVTTSVQSISTSPSKNRGPPQSHTPTSPVPSRSVSSSSILPGPNRESHPQRVTQLLQISPTSSIQRKRRALIRDGTALPKPLHNTNISTSEPNIARQQASEKERPQTQAIDVSNPFGIHGTETIHKPDNDLVTSPHRLHKVNVQRTVFTAPRKRPLKLDEDGMMLSKKLRDNDHYDSHARDPKPKVPPTAAAEPLAQNADLYHGLPCMDCGEDVGHKSDCHIGSRLTLASLSYKGLTMSQISSPPETSLCWIIASFPSSRNDSILAHGQLITLH